MNARSFCANGLRQLDAKLREYEEDGFQPTLALVFCALDMDSHGLARLFHARGIQLLGCNSSGEIVDNTLYKGIFSVLLMNVDTAAFHLEYFPGAGNDYFPIGAKIGEMAAQKFDDPAILLYTGGVGVDGESIIKGIQSQLGSEALIYGGMGSDNLMFKEVYVFTQDGVYNNGATALVFDQSKVRVSGLAYSGWNELGMTHTITRSKDNVVYEIDGKPALGFFQDYFPDLENLPPEESGRLFTIPAIYPFKIKRQGGVDFLRSVVMYDFREQTLVLGGGVREGDQFKFCPMPGFDVVNATVNSFQRLSREVGDVDAFIINSCYGRYNAFGPMFEDEVKGLYEVWQRPGIGYLSYGEFGNLGNGKCCEFHNVTCSLVTLKEMDG